MRARAGFGRLLSVVCMIGLGGLAVGAGDAAASQCPVMRDLGAFGGEESFGLAVNNRSDVVVVWVAAEDGSGEYRHRKREDRRPPAAGIA